jgi:hypothetical protein
MLSPWLGVYFEVDSAVSLKSWTLTRSPTGILYSISVESAYNQSLDI